MNEEIKKILEMIEHNQITADEGAKLISQLRPNDNGERSGDSGSGFFDWLKGSPPVEKDYEVTLGNDSLNTLRLYGKNSKIKIEGHSSNTIKIECEYKLKRGVQDQEPELIFENGKCELRYNKEAYKHMKINCKTPKEIHSAEISIETTNGRIKLEDFNCKKIACSSTNAGIKIEKIKAEKAKLSTTNGGINAEDATINNLECHTVNGGIRIDLDSIEKSSNVEAHTTNGGIRLRLPSNVSSEIGVKLEASTTNGGIHCDYADIQGEVSKRYVNAKSSIYDNAQIKVDIKLGTTNGGISVSA
jgi:DUF4097 and DUF4098 domain-containing protein YvlB